MKIRPSHVSSTLAASLVCASCAYAVDGVIDFQGQISDTTCAVAVNAGSNNGVVVLPSVSVSALPAVGATAGTTPFVITLSGCTGGTLNTASTVFEMGPNVDAAVGRLINTGTADGVQIELLNAAQSPLMVGAAGEQGDTPVDISSGGATLRYFARYYAFEAGVVPGTVVSRVDYTVQYQ
ncbi:fimbrial protein [Bordetella petrii]|uniref:fimbrial protein n=1 Tax=Bordetella petrii TaxID=94624 RepID=UPI001E393908|nr:fimbrial protein [Bordetella petrii]MCD0502947.1 type 1 fimbrial protein [Bordetella petrii]